MRKRAGALAPPEGEAGIRALLDGIPGAVYRREAAPPWRFAYVSDAIEAIAGYRAKDLVEKADKAMYAAKKTGKNLVCEYKK